MIEVRLRLGINLALTMVASVMYFIKKNNNHTYKNILGNL